MYPPSSLAATVTFFPNDITGLGARVCVCMSTVGGLPFCVDIAGKPRFHFGLLFLPRTFLALLSSVNAVFLLLSPRSISVVLLVAASGVLLVDA